MKRFLKEGSFDAADLIGVIVLVGGFILILSGRNGTIAMIMAAVVGHYFGRKNGK